MKIFVKVKPNSKFDKVEPISPNTFFIQTKAPPKEGKANKAVLKLLSEFLAIPQSSIKILRGVASREKLFEIT